MDIERDQFEELVQLHARIKDFKIQQSAKILNEYLPLADDPRPDKFNKFPTTTLAVNTKQSENLKERINLSSTATCTHVMVQYCKLWKKEDFKPQGKEFTEKRILGYWKYIFENLTLQKTVDPSRKEIDFELLDEFSILNILALLNGILNNVEKHATAEPNDGYKELYINMKNVRDHYSIEISDLIFELCKKYITDEFGAFRKNIHPFIFYRFFIILDEWQKNILKLEKAMNDNTITSKQEKIRRNCASKEAILNAKLHKKYEFEFEQFKQKYVGPKGYYAWFKDDLYAKGKTELYRQITLYNSGDESLFDVKRLIYSLLVVCRENRYGNRLVVEEALHIIFDVQFKTGLLPISHIVSNDFYKKIENDPKKRDNGIFLNSDVTASPQLTSFECYNDMLSEPAVKKELQKYNDKLKLAYYWVEQGLKKNSATGNPMGWVPEYESTHISESWVTAHILTFLMEYCEFVSGLINEEVRRFFNARKITEDDVKYVYSSYNSTEQIKLMVKNDNLCSALVFGPPGTGKTTIAKYLAKELRNERKRDCDYIELTPGLFLSNGENKIIQSANEIFDKLKLIKEAVVFFDEVDQLVKSRDDGGPVWIVTALLPKFAELRNQKGIKFILATNVGFTKKDNKIDESAEGLKLNVDTAITRLGRIDLILPMGATRWQDRLRLLMDYGVSVNKKRTGNKLFDGSADLFPKDSEALTTLTVSLRDYKENKTKYEGKEGVAKFVSFLRQTEYMSYSEIKRVLDNIFTSHITTTDPADSPQQNLKSIFFNGSLNDEPAVIFENGSFREFHEALHDKNPSLIKAIRYSTNRTDPSQEIKEIVDDNTYCNLESQESSANLQQTNSLTQQPP